MVLLRRCRLVDGCDYNGGDDALFALRVEASSGRIASIDRDDDGAHPPSHDDGGDGVDMRGATLCAGFLDIQMNGAFDVDFADPALRAEDVERVLRGLLAHGVTSVCPTLISSPVATYASAVPLLRHVMEAQRQQPALATCRVVGLHLEGPFLAVERKGAHAAWNLRSPDGGVLLPYGLNDSDVASGVLRVVTLAPELPGALPAFEALRRQGVVASIGHTTADLALAAEACARGATLVTHLFNAMSSFSHRAPGVAGLLGGAAAVGKMSAEAAATVGSEAAATIPSHDSCGTLPFHSTPVPLPWPSAPPFYSLIADGVHVHPAAVALAYRAHPAGAVLVTDAMRAMGLPVGAHTYGELAVELHAGHGDGPYEGRHVVLAGTDTLAGAVAPLDECVRNLSRWTACGLGAAVRAAAATPARLLRVDAAIGRFAVGAFADFAVLCAAGGGGGGVDRGVLPPLAAAADWYVGETWIGGRQAWRRAVGV